MVCYSQVVPHVLRLNHSEQSPLPSGKARPHRVCPAKKRGGERNGAPNSWLHNRRLRRRWSVGLVEIAPGNQPAPSVVKNPAPPWPTTRRDPGLCGFDIRPPQWCRCCCGPIDSDLEKLTSATPGIAASRSRLERRALPGWRLCSRHRSRPPLTTSRRSGAHPNRSSAIVEG